MNKLRILTKCFVYTDQSKSNTNKFDASTPISVENKKNKNVFKTRDKKISLQVR